jgi:hypothetical protein
LLLMCCYPVLQCIDMKLDHDHLVGGLGQSYRFVVLVSVLIIRFVNQT